MSVLIFCAALSCHVLARPVLQPEVKEYRALGGAFDAKSLPVFHQRQRQHFRKLFLRPLSGGHLRRQSHGVFPDAQERQLFQPVRDPLY